ncbi:MAG: hypothetical protein ACI4NW_04625 [Stenotrophomonas sp.]
MSHRSSGFPLHLLAGLVVLASWLGWVVAGLHALGIHPAVDLAALAQLRERLRLALPAGSRQPLAVLLQHCPCATGTDSPAWQQLQSAMKTLGGLAVTLPGGADTAIELLVLDGDGNPVHAGPLQPSLMACGQSNADVSRSLPGLLDASQPPLHLPSPCPC